MSSVYWKSKEVSVVRAQWLREQVDLWLKVDTREMRPRCGVWLL